jgi:hypothetical protein
VFGFSQIPGPSSVLFGGCGLRAAAFSPHPPRFFSSPEKKGGTLARACGAREKTHQPSSDIFKICDLKDFCLFITGFPIDLQHSIQKKLTHTFFLFVTKFINV